MLRCFFTVRSIHHHKTTVPQSLQRRGEMVESMKGWRDLAEKERLLTADKELTANIAKIYGSLSLALEERQRSRAKKGALWQSRKTCSRQHTFVVCL